LIAIKHGHSSLLRENFSEKPQTGSREMLTTNKKTNNRMNILDGVHYIGIIAHNQSLQNTALFGNSLYTEQQTEGHYHDEGMLAL